MEITSSSRSPLDVLLYLFLSFSFRFYLSKDANEPQLKVFEIPIDYWDGNGEEEDLNEEEEKE